MKTQVFLLFGFLLGVQVAHAQLQASHFYKVDSSEISSKYNADISLKTEVEGSFFSNQEMRERLMNVRVYSKFDVEMWSAFGAEFEPYVVIKQGETQSRFSRLESSPLQMRQGFFYYRPIEGLSLQAGAINQDFLSSPLLVKDQTFLSLLSGYSHIRDKYEWQAIFQAGMPSVVNNLKRINEIEDVPYFSSLFTYTEWLPSDLYSFKGHLTGFLFSNLPTFIAEQSQVNGNTVEGGRFVYSYKGVDADISAQFKLSSKVLFSVGYNILMNFGTSFDKGLGERVYTTFDMDFFKQAKLYFRLEYFNNRSDSAPAYFNSEIYGHNDRKGFLAELKSFFPKGNIETGLRYVLSVPVHSGQLRAFKDVQNALSVFVRTRYFTI